MYKYEGLPRYLPSEWHLGNPPGPAAVVLTRANPATGEDVAPPMYARLELIKGSTVLHQEADKNLCPGEKAI